MNTDHECANFGARIKVLIGKRSIRSCAAEWGVTEGSLRQYLAGSIPGLDKVVHIAKVTDVSLEWLATGEGPMQVADRIGADAAVSSANAIDEELLARVGEEIVELYRQENARISQRQLARLQAQLYGDLVTAYDDQAERLVGIKGMVQQLRRDLRAAPAGSDTGKRLA